MWELHERIFENILGGVPGLRPPARRKVTLATTWLIIFRLEIKSGLLTSQKCNVQSFLKLMFKTANLQCSKSHSNVQPVNFMLQKKCNNPKFFFLDRNDDLHNLSRIKNVLVLVSIPCFYSWHSHTHPHLQQPVVHVLNTLMWMHTYWQTQSILLNRL